MNVLTFFNTKVELLQILHCRAVKNKASKVLIGIKVYWSELVPHKKGHMR